MYVTIHNSILCILLYIIICIISTKLTVTIGRRRFSVAGPAAWNNLSTTLKDFKLTFSAFKRLLKTELFKSM